MKSVQPNWGKMTAEELAEATKQFDKPIRFEDTRPLSKAQRARWERALKAGEPRPGELKNGERKNGQTNPLGLDARLLVQAKAYAKRKKLPLREIIERGLRREMAVD